ncbi:PPOX class F420-dependent oxidoreductase [Streptomyces swartbergensis]|uniref:PPOX class F420-dependent enzyme n=1 Tax=Streptomyces swartbergensis TaxID=487165 RepID=A0A243S8U0_9ACTN|nr:PPOX class F420-dependent oxidoreductase [Streptomyces swartbergensis]OUD04144.1 PPOX class F420-dependent enzyme [Streptomyces swartbergensis]
MHSMSTEEWHAFVTRGAPTGRFATVGADGTPNITPVWYVFDGEDFLFTTGDTTAKARNLRRDPRASLCVADDAPPFAYVEARGEVTLSEDLGELLDVATRAGARYMGAERAEAFGRRNAVPGELVVRLRPAKVIAYGGITD